MRFPSSFRRGLIWLFLFSCLGHVLAAKEKWVAVSYPEFTVVSSLTPKEAEAWSAEFAQYVATLQTFFEVDKSRGRPPLTIVVFDTVWAFNRYRPLDPKGKPLDVAGFFRRRESWAVAGLGSLRESEDLRRTIFHEGVHWFLSGAERSKPLWLEEGLAEVFSTFRVLNDQAQWGRAIKEHPILLHRESVEPLEKFLTTPDKAWHDGDPRRTQFLYAESWAFLHYVLFGKHQIPTNAWKTYSDAVFLGQPPAEAFRQAFGKTFKEMDREFVRYLDGETSFFVPKRPLVQMPTAKAQPATAVQVDDALGRLALGANRFDIAITHARAVIAVAPDDPRGYELLGAALDDKKDEAGALAAFDQAITRNSRDYVPYLEKAFSMQKEVIGSAGPAVEMSASSNDREVASLYEKVIALNPGHLLSYQNLAGLFGVMEPWNQEDVKVLEQGHELFPQDEMIQIGRAILAERGGDHERAGALISVVIADPNPADKLAQEFAGKLNEGWKLNALTERINRLIKENKNTEAMALVDDAIAQNISPDIRRQLTVMRRVLINNLSAEKIQEALWTEQWQDARRLINELLASDVSPTMKNSLRRTLKELDEKKLGLEMK